MAVSCRTPARTNPAQIFWRRFPFFALLVERYLFENSWKCFWILLEHATAALRTVWLSLKLRCVFEVEKVSTHAGRLRNRLLLSLANLKLLPMN
jgi:hypothetical protein